MRARTKPPYSFNPGMLDQTIDLVPPAQWVRTEGGSHTMSDDTAVTVPAHIEYGSGTETMENSRIDIDQVLRATVRDQGLDTIGTEWKMVYNTITYDIRRIDPIGRKKYLTIHAYRVND